MGTTFTARRHPSNHACSSRQTGQSAIFGRRPSLSCSSQTATGRGSFASASSRTLSTASLSMSISGSGLQAGSGPFALGGQAQALGTRFWQGCHADRLQCGIASPGHR